MDVGRRAADRLAGQDLVDRDREVAPGHAAALAVVVDGAMVGDLVPAVDDEDLGGPPGAEEARDLRALVVDHPSAELLGGVEGGLLLGALVAVRVEVHEVDLPGVGAPERAQPVEVFRGRRTAGADEEVDRGPRGAVRVDGGGLAVVGHLGLEARHGAAGVGGERGRGEEPEEGDGEASHRRKGYGEFDGAPACGGGPSLTPPTLYLPSPSIATTRTMSKPSCTAGRGTRTACSIMPAVPG